MSHIHTKPGQHDHTISAYIIRLDTPEPSLMLHTHKKLKRFMQFGGHIELDENPWQAIAHEIREESGYDLNQLKLLQPKIRQKTSSRVLLHPMPLSYNTHQFGELDHYHTNINYAFATSENPRHQVSDGESKNIKLFTLAELEALKSTETFDDIKQTGSFILEEVLGNWEMVKPPEPSMPPPLI